LPIHPEKHRPEKPAALKTMTNIQPHKPLVDLAPAGTIGPLNKGLGAIDPVDEHSQRKLDWNLLREDLSLPSAVLYQSKMLHNLEWMRQFVAAYGLQLAPHGKTTMAPRLFQMQIEAGAWGITLATAHQVKVAYAHGIRRVLMANQLVGKANMAIISALLPNPAFEFYCLVDSHEQVHQLGRFFAAQSQRLNVLVELGVDGGRAGIRNEEQLQALLTALLEWKDSIALCGVEVYEGVLDNENEIRSFLKHVVETTGRIAALGRFDRSPIMLSGAGSAWYDIVAEAFSSASFAFPVELILRPGCYLTHDVGAYRTAQARILSSNPVAQKMNSGLVPALHVWAYVQSIPEPGKAIIAMGKRDAAFDSGLPVPALHFRPGGENPNQCPKHWALTKMMDQHAFLQISAGDDIQIGDMIAFDICHPCLTFDKWRALPILDDHYQVADVVQTFF
jgi:D-serine dehydratase